jgi:hypothetical protein
MSEVTISTGDALAIRRLLWDLASSPATSHNSKVEAFHWAAVLDDLAGMPPSPTLGEPTQEVIRFYETVAARLNEQIAALRSTVE